MSLNTNGAGDEDSYRPSTRKLTTPLIFAGDLNVNPNTPAMGLFDGWLEDLTKTYDTTDTLSPLGKVRDVACDHILTSTDVHVRSFANAQ